jgi:excisionase family DNA binding protein
MEKKFYTIKEAAEMLSISTKLIYKLIKQEEFPCMKIGGRILIPSTLLTEYIEKNTTNVF